MHLFVRDLSGHSLSFDATNLSGLRYAIADRTGVPIEEQRLVFGGRQMEDTDGTLESFGLVEDSNVSLLLRLRGGAPKKRCGAYISTTDRCSQPALRMIGECSHCSVAFCARHRLPEEHSCPNLESFKQEAFLKNKTKLEAEKMVGSKIQSM